SHIMLKTAINPALRNSGLCNLWLCAILLFIVPASLVAQQEAQPLPSAANEFVQQILSHIGPSTSISVDFQNVSSLSPDSQQSLQNTILNAFHSVNIRLVKAEQAQAEIQIAFSEDWQGYVWLATVKQGTNSQVVIKKIARTPTASSSRMPTLTIRKIPV